MLADNIHVAGHLVDGHDACGIFHSIMRHAGRHDAQHDAAAQRLESIAEGAALAGVRIGDAFRVVIRDTRHAGDGSESSTLAVFINAVESLCRFRNSIDSSGKRLDIGSIMLAVDDCDDGRDDGESTHMV